MKAVMFALIFAIYFTGNAFAQQALCDYKIEILVNSSEFESKDFSWRMRAARVDGKSTNITGTAEIEDSNGKLIRKYMPWTNESISKQKTSNEYTPNLNQGEYKIISRISVGCEDTDKNNNIDAKIIRINNKNNEINAAINQNKLLDSKINDAIKNETVNQTTTNQTSENKTSRMRVSSLTTDSKNESDQLIASEEDNVIQLRNSDSKKSQNKLTTAAVQKSEIVYESSSEKAKEWIMVGLLTLSILLNIILIWKR